MLSVEAVQLRVTWLAVTPLVTGETGVEGAVASLVWRILNQLKLSPPVVNSILMTRLPVARLGPATVAVAQVCHPPVLPWVMSVASFTPSTYTLTVWLPVLLLASRRSNVYAAAVCTLTVYSSHSVAAIAPRL